MFPEDLSTEAEQLLAALRHAKLKIATAESCTGGLIAGLLTEIPGSSDVVERGFVSYSNAAKIGLLGVGLDLLLAHGAVSREVAGAMADGAVRDSAADVSIAVTGVAGPGGGSPEKPVGLVFIASARKGRPTLVEECRFGDIGRSAVRLATIRKALALINRQISP